MKSPSLKPSSRTVEQHVKTLNVENDKNLEASSEKKRGGDEPCLIPRLCSTSTCTSRSNGGDSSKIKDTRYATPYSSLWVFRRLQEGTDRAIGILRNWVHKKKLAEATHDAVQDIAAMCETDAIATLNELAKTKRFIRGTRGNQMNVPVVLSTLDDQRSFTIEALLDSGCT